MKLRCGKDVAAERESRVMGRKIWSVEQEAGSWAFLACFSEFVPLRGLCFPDFSAVEQVIWALLRHFLKFASFLQLKLEYIQGKKGTNFQNFS